LKGFLRAKNTALICQISKQIKMKTTISLQHVPTGSQNEMGFFLNAHIGYIAKFGQIFLLMIASLVTSQN
jgi:hypothetical protein